MNKSNDSQDEFERLNKAEQLLEEEWDDERTSQVTLNLNVPPHQTPQTPSQFDKLKEKLPSRKQAAIGGAIAMVLGVILEVVRQMGWFN